MINDSTVKIYINPSKPYYYPGENFAASILLDVLDTTNCDKMQIITKGKVIVKAIQKTSVDTYFESISNESDDDNQIKNRKSKRDEDSSSESQKDTTSIAKEIDEINKIFKYKKIIDISDNNYIVQGKYSFPFEVELPENIPSSFLFMEKNTYIEIIYTAKVKLNKINIKEAIPIVIRQKEKEFNYPRSNDYSKSIMGCCFDNNEVHIKLSSINKYSLSNNEIKLNVVLNNSKCDIQGSPLKIELYQKITLFPKNKNKKIKITKIVGTYEGKKNIKPRDKLNKDILLLMDKADYTANHLKKTKSIKYFRHKDFIPFLNQSIKSNYVNCEYEAYAEVQFPNWTVEEIGVFLSIVIYPPEKGILSKTVASISKEFINSKINKKVYLTNKSKEDGKEFQSKNNKSNNYYKTNRYYENSESEEEKKDRKRFSLMKVKSFGFKEKNSSESNDNNEKNDEENINDDENNNDNNIDNNLNIKDNENQYENDGNIDFKDKGSFGNYKEKKNVVYIDTNSNNIKKEFNQDYLNDALDDDFLDKESSQ